jgi:hypothetical protein
VTAPRLTAFRRLSTSLLLAGVISVPASAGDLSRYRDFQLGADLETISKQIGTTPLQAKLIHSRPALLQELEWRPQPLGPSSAPEPVKEVVFSFFNGELSRIAVDYDRYEIEGMTTDDLVDAISTAYGAAAKPAPGGAVVQGQYGDPEDVVARWQDADRCFELIRTPYGPGFRLVGVLKRLDTQAQAATLQAGRMDSEDAPRREAELQAKEAESWRVQLEKARLANKVKFRP